MLSDGYIVDLKSVMLRYSNGVKALKNIDLGLVAPSFQYLTGGNGAGKSSIIKMINLDIKPTAGNLRLFGVDIADMTDEEISKTKQKIGLISQGVDLVDSMTMVENVALPLKIIGVRKKEREQQAMEILDWLNVSSSKDCYPYELSCGERQCVAIARAIVKKPVILLADDPICYLDSRMANRVISLFFELSKRNTCVLITNNNDQRIPPMLHEGREIKITSGMLIDNVMNSRQSRDDLPIAM